VKKVDSLHKHHNFSPIILLEPQHTPQFLIALSVTVSSLGSPSGSVSLSLFRTHGRWVVPVVPFESLVDGNAPLTVGPFGDEGEEMGGLFPPVCGFGG